MAGPYCKDCVFFYSHVRGTEGECRDPSKRIYSKYCGPRNEAPNCDQTDTCQNWQAHGLIAQTGLKEKD